MDNDQEPKVNGSFLLPLSLKRWIEAEAERLTAESRAAGGEKVSTAEVVRRALEQAREAVAA